MSATKNDRVAFMGSILFSVIILTLSFVLAANIITTSTGGTSYSVDEDVGFIYNITVNNTDTATTANITQVNITIPNTFTFLADSNGTDAGTPTLTNTSTVLSWDNDGLVMNLTWKYFWFNATASTPGSYNLTISTTNSTGTKTTNISVQINDTTAPTMYSYSFSNNTKYYTNQTINFFLLARDISPISTFWYNKENVNSSIYIWAANHTGTEYIYFFKSEVNYSSQGIKNITFYSNDSTGNIGSIVYFFNITDLNTTNTFIVNDTTYAPNTNITTVVVPYNSSVQNITVSNSTKEVTVDVSQAIIEGVLNVNTNLTLINNASNLSVIFPNNVSINSSGWDGGIVLPIVNQSNFTAPVISGYTTNATLVMEVGSQVDLNFSSSVEVVLGGMAGKKAAWGEIGNSTLTDIPIVCNSGNSTNSSIPTNINSTGSRECYIYDGNNLNIWTYHFTRFAAYDATPTTAPTEEDTTTSGGGGTPTYYPTESNLQEGYTKSLGKLWKLSFISNNKTHQLKLDSLDINNQSATITVSSEPQTKTLLVGEEWKINLNNDNDYDLLVRLDEVTSTRAEIFMQEINESISGEIKEAQQDSSQTQEPETTTKDRYDINYGLYSAVIFLVLIIGFLSYFFISKHKKKH